MLNDYLNNEGQEEINSLLCKLARYQLDFQLAVS
jgi:hypothetical protein